MTVSKFISFDHQPPWRTVAVMGRDGLVNAAGRTGGKASRRGHGGWSLTVVRHGGRTNRRGPKAIGFCKRRAPRRHVLLD
jgi:hypothetical protein